ncbi:helix-turn-helix domain-containing protein [Ferruginibacter sp. HRS2-29]|uniref:helix-turn-helix domain-containing protein n=1 Tax=Ferruginibacter sp. HRS2-29 TaxID=2487334 RepID=UPI0020CD2AD5|nr:helix-turn-helix transcriptional regulator [Ferruginibacter sp. HRS2-29]MCP9752734.1 helix-turn-helix domain-containing protein [Ferruginibacter sp. HRS2-29]
MELYQKIITARKKKGLTQEQLADLTNVTVRTIQRIESGESAPRPFTIKAIAAALESSFEELTMQAAENIGLPEKQSTIYKEEDSKHFLKMLCLSCFSYIVLPFVHFLIPRHILKRSNEQNPLVIAFARKVIRGQLYWKFTLWFLMLLTLAYNLSMASWSGKVYLINYLVPFFTMYLLNAIIIAVNLRRIDKLHFGVNTTA